MINILNKTSVVLGLLLITLVCLLAWAFLFYSKPKPITVSGKTPVSTLPDSVLTPRFYAGKNLFATHCRQCHFVKQNETNSATQVSLWGITQRRAIEWLVPYVKNSNVTLMSSKPEALNHYLQNKKYASHKFQLSDASVKTIFAYIQTLSAYTDLKTLKD